MDATATTEDVNANNIDLLSDLIDKNGIEFYAKATGFDKPVATLPATWGPDGKLSVTVMQPSVNCEMCSMSFKNLKGLHTHLTRKHKSAAAGNAAAAAPPAAGQAAATPATGQAAADPPAAGQAAAGPPAAFQAAAAPPAAGQAAAAAPAAFPDPTLLQKVPSHFTLSFHF